MTNHDGILIDDTKGISFDNRGLYYGDALFETIKVVNGKIIFWEDHYFRLMSSMRILRMEIPMSFTMEFLEAEITRALTGNDLLDRSARVRLTVFRKAGGLYKPTTNDISFLISVQPLDEPFYILSEKPYEVDLYKDHFLAPGLLSNCKTNNRLVNVLGSIYAEENALQGCLLLNTDKHVVEGLSGNLFLRKGKLVKTPPLSDGPIKGVLRKQVLDLLATVEAYDVEETSISPFELQKADELFLTNVIGGILPITKYRKKSYGHELAKQLLPRLNTKVRLG
ncbi:aminotransferase class IV [Sungkyunkwania multivorans]|uniref:branched-chain-amino-acid transaminase n=1 Tax=Sungkyunkwania multivorans TaxID=1173618 RepID=A0ABW3CXD9_9FLAO